jgi:branched-chain amino acid transport system substrate-binding protein
LRQHPRALATAFILVLYATACTQDRPELEEAETLTIYSSLPLQGDSKPQSEDIVRAMEMALDESGGMAGSFRIEYISLDDADPELGSWEPGQVEENASTAVADDTTIAYLGEFNSGASLVSIPILNQAGILQVSPTNTYVGLTRSDGAEEGEPDKYYPTGERTYGRVVPADHVQAGAIVSSMRDRGCTNVFILNDGETYGRGIADQVERLARDESLIVSGNDTIDVGAENFEGPDERLKESHADCFFFGGITQNRAPEVTQAVADVVPGIQMFFPDGVAESAFTQNLDAELARSVYITNPTLDPAAYPPAGQEFLENFSNEYGRDPEPYAIYGFEAMSVALDSIARAGDAVAATPEGRHAVIDAFFETRDRQSVLGTYDIDPYGDTTLTDYGGYRVEGGGLVFDTVIEAIPPKPIDGPSLDPGSVPATPSTDPSTEATTPLDGTWRGGKVTLEDIMREYPEKEARFVFEENDVESYMITTLELHDGIWESFVSADGGPEIPAQSGSFQADGDRIRMSDPAFGDTFTYRYELDGDSLTIHLLESTAPDEAVFLFAHYEAEPFVRVA